MLVLSLFPGADLFGMAFEQEGFTVVRGPDALLGGDIRRFHVPPGYFDGVIGGPPCQEFSIARTQGESEQGNLVPEFERIVEEAEPIFWVMENVPAAPVPEAARWWDVLDAWHFGSAQHRNRLFASNLRLHSHLSRLPAELRHPDPFPCVTATEYKGCGSDARRASRKLGRRLTLHEMNAAMGLPADFATPALTTEASFRVRGNGVPLEMGRAIARAVRATIEAASNRRSAV